MAWIKMRVLLDRDPKVMAIARFLASRDEFISWLFDGPSSNAKVTKTVTVAVTIDGLRRVWGQANECAKSEFPDVIMTHTSLSDLDYISGIPSLGMAMASVQWAIVEGTNIRLPNFLKGNTLQEERALTNAERQAKHRARLKRSPESENGVTKSNGDFVTKVTPRSERQKDRISDQKALNSDLLTLDAWKEAHWEDLRLMGYNGDDSSVIAQIRWLVSQARPDLATQWLDALNGPKAMKSYPRNPVAYVRKSFAAHVGGLAELTKMLKQAPKKKSCPPPPPVAANGFPRPDLSLPKAQSNGVPH